MDAVFGELDHRLSVVKRWGVLHTIQTQSVAEHVFNVERILWNIAHPWFNVHGSDMPTLLHAAHHHEDEEVFTGDMPTMVKPYFDKAKFVKDHANVLSGGFKNSTKTKHLLALLKLADKMEGYRFLAMELALGNSFVVEHYKQECPRVWEAAITAVDAAFYPDPPKQEAHVKSKLSAWMSQQQNLKSTRYSGTGQ